MSKDQALKEKEKELKMKELRRELDEQIQEQLEQTASEEALVSADKVDSQEMHEEDLKDASKAKAILESLLFTSSKPLTVNEMKKVLKSLTPSEIKGHLASLKDDYNSSGRCFDLIEIAGGYELSTKKEFAPWILKVELQKKARNASNSALETLAILAYKQPLTRAEIEELRGVDVSGVLSTLLEKQFVKIVGKKEVPGRPFLYGTTDKFLEHFGLNDIKDLPDIDEIKQLVESSVKKEDLVGTTNVVEVTQEDKDKRQQEIRETIKQARAENEQILEEISSDISSLQIKKIDTGEKQEEEVIEVEASLDEGTHEEANQEEDNRPKNEE